MSKETNTPTAYGGFVMAAGAGTTNVQIYTVLFNVCTDEEAEVAARNMISAYFPSPKFEARKFALRRRPRAGEDADVEFYWEEAIARP